jgi:hypothetical protein
MRAPVDRVEVEMTSGVRAGVKDGWPIRGEEAAYVWEGNFEGCWR